MGTIRRHGFAVCAALAVAGCGGAQPRAQEPAASTASAGDPYAERPEAQPQPAAQPPVGQAAAPAQAPAPPASAMPPPPPAPVGPVRERANQLREAADLLDKAEAARERDAKSFAEQLFSSAELIVGPDALASLAPRFREGAPPRVTTPLKPVPRDQAPQPAAVGDSEAERPEQPKPRRGSIAGTVQLDGKPLSGEMAVVTLQAAAGKNAARRGFPTARVVEQRGRQFAPRVLVVPVGSVVSFPNFDPVFHNVFSTSSTKPFDLGLYKNGESREVTFDREGTVRLGCNLHANMSAFIVVVSAPHYTITDGNGRFGFRSVEPGKYLLRVYSERSTRPLEKPIEVKPGKNELALGTTADAPAGPLPDKFGVPRVAKTP